MNLVEMQVKEYIGLVASDAPAPGGGSASALCGAQGIGLIAMVAKLTAGKEKFLEFKPVCDEVSARADALCAKLTNQVDVDTQAYGRIADAFKLPKATDEEKAARRRAIADATLYATEVPFETMTLAVEGLECAKRLLGSFNTNCASDVGCGALGLVSCVKGAWLNVLINVGGVKDEAKAAHFRTDGQALVERAETLGGEVYAAIEKLCQE